jgi:putative PEP-CTERM system TPR-repeat lipoprotein
MQLRPIATALLFATLSTPFLAGCNKLAKATPEEHIQRAKDAQAKGDIKTSIIELKSAIQEQPNNAQARLLLGELYIKAQQGDAAEKELRKAKELGVKEESITVLLGEALLIQQEYKKVLDNIQAGSETSLLNRARILRERGDAQIGLGHLEEGCSLFQNAKEVFAAYAPAYRELAKCSISHHNYDEAKARLDAALKINAQDADTWAQLGELELIRNNQEAAKSAFLKAHSIDRGHVRASMGLVTLYLRNGELENAATEVQAARKENPGNVLVRYNEALVSFRQGKYKQARDELQEIMHNMPNHMPSVLLSGAVAFALGSYEQANQYLSKFLGQHPGNYYAAKVLAATELKLNQPQEALQIIGKLLAAFPEDPQILALAGTAYSQTKDYLKATEYLEKAAAIEPKNATVRTGLAYAHLESGDTQQAINALESAVALDPSQVRADAMLVITHLRQKEYDKALAAAQSWQKYQPNNPLIYNLEGGAYLGKKDTASARKSFELALTVLPTYLPAAENLAKLDLIDKNPVAAKGRFERILASDKNNVGAMLNLADLAMLAGKDEEYLDWLEKATKAKPTLLPPYRLMTAYYLRNKDTKNALSIARRAQTSNPGNPDVLDLLGATQLAIGSKADALATYNSLVNLASKSPLAHLRLASVQALMQDKQGARASLKRALGLKPDYRDAQTALVLLDEQTGSYDEALVLTRQIQQANPGIPLGAGLEGDVLMAQKQYAAAAKAYGKALEVGNSGLFAVKVYQALSVAGQTAQAENSLLSWLKKQPNDLQTRAYLGEQYGKAGRNAQAIEQYEYVISKSPASVPILNNLAWVYAKQRDPRALATAEKAYQLAPADPVVLDTYGWILLEQGNAARAAQLLQGAAEKAPTPTIRYHLATALLKTGDKAKARKELEQLLRTAKPFPEEQAARALLTTLR